MKPTSYGGFLLAEGYYERRVIQYTSSSSVGILFVSLISSIRVVKANIFELVMILEGHDSSGVTGLKSSLLQ
jgi:hypothetical protein